MCNVPTRIKNCLTQIHAGTSKIYHRDDETVQQETYDTGNRLTVVAKQKCAMRFMFSALRSIFRRRFNFHTLCTDDLIDSLNKRS
jgi:hypothetical protein